MAAAESYVQDESAPTTFDPEQVTATLNEIDELRLPLGWEAWLEPENYSSYDANTWLLKVMGLLLTIVAVSLGAPFWFDVLNRLVNLRMSGAKPKPAESERQRETDGKS